MDEHSHALSLKFDKLSSDWPTVSGTAQGNLGSPSWFLL